MKNFIFTFLITLFMSCGLLAQTYTTGNITFFTGYTGKIDVTSSTVTLTLIGPSTSWLGVGFNVDSLLGMNDTGKDAVIFNAVDALNAPVPIDRSFTISGAEPTIDASQNWTISSNTISFGVRTLVATRARDTGDPADYVFPLAAQPLNLIYARPVGSNLIGWHGLGNCGATVANLTLGTNDFEIGEFKMYPNPSKGYLTIDFPSKMVNEGEVKIYDNLGRVVRKQTITNSENKINTSDLTTGTYIVALRTDYGNATQTLIID